MTTIKISRCCEWEVLKADQNGSGYMIDLCSKCKKPCTTKYVCSMCYGKGVTPADEDDGEGHIMVGVGETPCTECQPITPEHDGDGEDD
jgi:hypothetical protein